MRTKKILFFITTFVFLFFTSCSYDDFEIPANEAYTRDFIKTFGLIDPAQDWNLAVGANVMVMVGDTPAHVKVYMKVDKTYYLAADLESVSGIITIPFDMPEDTEDILVMINDRRYYTAPGEIVDPASVYSRDLQNPGTNEFGNVTVTVERTDRELSLTPASIDDAIDILPEAARSEPPFSYGETNFGKVTQNFFATATEFYIFPEYWQTNCYSIDYIGIYWYVAPNTEGASEVTKYESPSGEDDSTVWIKRVPFFVNPRDFVTPVDASGNRLSYPEDTPDNIYNHTSLDGAVNYLSQGVHVKFNQEISFGFYIQQGERIMYSESKLNEYFKIEGVEGDWYQPSYVATFTNGTDTNHNIKRHLCFEDWYGGDWDLNDLVFRVYGFDTLPEVETGHVYDIDRPDEKPYNWLLAAEDLGATDDFDFNDIIMGISAVTVSVKDDLPVDTKVIGKGSIRDDIKMYKKVTFKALAAGGTRKAYVFYGDMLLSPDGYETRAEWHSWFGDGNISSTTMINTGLGRDNEAGATCTIYFGKDGKGIELFSLGKLDGSIDAFGKNFKIGIDTRDNTVSSAISTDYFTKEGNYFVKPADAGSAPQMFIIPDLWADGETWQWPVERNHIASCYPGFATWIKDSGASDWYKSSGNGVCRLSK